ncbi:MAG: cytidylate kinase-like family protein [Dehalococcoidia bacterium]|nr:cytidylate kinase-like family protein [Dehalococcoidia bacterium]
MAVIATGGLSGGGGRFLGPELSRRIDADYVDRLILSNVSRELQATVEALDQREQRPPTRAERFSRLIQRIMERTAYTGGGPDPYFGTVYPEFLISEYDELPTLIATRGHEIDDDAYIGAIRTVIEDLASGGNVVIVGRGAHVILQDNPDVLRVGLIATFEDRVERVMVRERMTQSEAELSIQARDAARLQYFQRFFNIDTPDAAEFYHLVINTSEMNLDAATDIIIRASEELEMGRLSRHAFRVEP